MQLQNGKVTGPLRLHVEIEQWPLKEPFRISGYVFDTADLLIVTLEKDGQVGRGEAAGVYYKNDSPRSMLEQIAALRGTIEAGMDRSQLRTIVGPGGARNAVDCALWDLEAKLTGSAVWQLAGLEEPRPRVTAFTCGADEPERMAATARRYESAKAIKLKLTGEAIDAERVRAVREALPSILLTVDANQGFDPTKLERLLPVLMEARVALIEQPFPVGAEAWLDDLRLPIPVCADESVQSLADLPALARRFDVVNIKLDKCGGLTEGLAMAHAAQKLGLEVMVGNMLGTSLGMAPAYMVAQLCTFVDLDGPLFLRGDRSSTVKYVDGYITCPDAVWG